jgi:hypothetical protein
MKYLIPIFLFSVTVVGAQTFSTGEYQINRKKSSAGFEVAKLLEGSNITFIWNDSNKTVTIASSGGVVDGDKGDITVSSSGTVWAIDNGSVTLAKQADMATSSLVYRKTAGSGAPEINTLATLKTDLGLGGTNTGDQTITLTGDVTGSGTGSFDATIANDAVTFAKMQQISSIHLVGRHAGSTGNMQEVGVGNGLEFHGSGIRRSALIGDVTASAGNNSTTIVSGAVTYDKMQNVTAASRLLGRQSGTSGSVQEILLGTGLTMSGTTLNASTTGIGGTVGTTANAIPKANGTAGNVLQGSGVTIDGSDLVSTSGVASGFITSITPTGPSERFSNKVTHAGFELTWHDDVSTTRTGVLVAPSSCPPTNPTWELPDASGTLALTSQMAGTKTIAVFTPRDNQPPATTFATLDTRNSIAVLDFDDATEEAAVFVFVIPEAAVLTSGIIVRITWTAAATSGACRWGAQWMRCNTDIDADSFDVTAIHETTTTTNATSGIPNVTSITCTAIDGVTVGNMYRLRVYRDAGDVVNDTMVGDAELLTVEVRTVD